MKKIYKKAVLLLTPLLMLMMSGLAACNSTPVQTSPDTSVANTSAKPEVSDKFGETGSETGNKIGPYVITDLLGREVEIPGEIRTIVAINGAARMLTYAGATEKLVGVTDMDKSSAVAMPYSVVNAEAFSKLASVGSGGSGDTVYVEELVELAPELIFAFTDDTESVNNVQSQTGIPVVALYTDQIFAQNFYDTLTLVGSIMGTEKHCTEVIDAMKGWADDLNNRTKNITDGDKPTVYTGAVSFRGGHGFEGTYGGYPPFTVIHAKNVVDETGKTGALLIDLEKVAIWDPDIIFLNPSNMSLVGEDYEVNASFYDNLKAVKNGRIYAQPAYNYNWCNMEIAMVDAYYAGTVIFPEQFADVDFAEIADEIFNVMIGQDYLKILNDADVGFEPLTIGK